MTSTMTPGPADPTIWREHGDPLVVGAEDGPLAGETIAVKDLYAVVGSRRGAGNPTWLAETTMSTTTAPVLVDLLEAGAVVRGIAQTDELAYSLAGTNHHYGTPANSTSPGRIPGGSSSGSASAVGLRQATIGLGTDTGGSIRVPAAYQGLFGIRTTHGLLSLEGVLPLAPSFDTVGWITEDAALLARVGEVLLPPSPGPADSGASTDVVVLSALLELAEDDVAETIESWAGDVGSTHDDARFDDLGQWRAAFQTCQAWEAWDQHGAWLEGRLDVLGPDVQARFRVASETTDSDAQQARTVLDTACARIRGLVGDRVVALPTVPALAPPLGHGLEDRLRDVRDATLQLTCLAGIAGLPAVNLPLRTTAGVPCGVSLLAARGRDRDLLSLVAGLSSP